MLVVKISPTAHSALGVDNDCVFLIKDVKEIPYKPDNRVYICDVRHLNGLEEAVKRLKSEAET